MTHIGLVSLQPLFYAPLIKFQPSITAFPSHPSLSNLSLFLSLPLHSSNVSLNLKTKAPYKMSKAVVYTVIATATLLIFIVLSPLNLEESKGRLNNRRFGYKILERAPTFDPLVTKIERESEQKNQQHKNDFDNKKNVAPRTGLGSTTTVSEIKETYEYLTSGGTLNTTLRLIILFPLLDRDPKDGFVGFNELESWVTQRALERLDYATQVELESKDKNGDLALSFREYLPDLSEKDIGDFLISFVSLIGFVFNWLISL